MPYSAPLDPHVYVAIDFNDDGTLVSAYDDISADVLGGTISSEGGRDQGRLIGGPKVPTASWGLLNEDRRYGTPYAGSPLHGYLQPGHKCAVGRVLGDSTVTMNDSRIAMNEAEALMGGTSITPVFTGHTAEGVEHYAIGHRTVDMRAYGLIERLTRAIITVPYVSTTTTGIAMQTVFDAAGLLPSEIDFDGSSVASGRPLLHWYVDGRSAWDVARQIWLTEGPPAALYEDALGKIHWEGRFYRTTSSRCYVVQQTFSTASNTYPFVSVEYEPSYFSVINDMSMEITVRALGAVAKIWDYGSQIVLLPNETVTLFAHATDPIVNPQAFVYGTDYQLAAGSLVVATVTLISPLTVRIVLTAGATGATVDPVSGNQGIILRAQPLVEISSSIVVGTVNTAASQAKYGKRGPPSELQSAIWPSLSPATAAGLIDGYLDNYANPREVVKVSLDGFSFPLLQEILSRQVSDRIHVYDGWAGIDLDVSVEQIAHTIDDRNNHRCVLTCEKIITANWGRFNLGLWDVAIWGQ